MLNGLAIGPIQESVKFWNLLLPFAIRHVCNFFNPHTNTNPQNWCYFFFLPPLLRVCLRLALASSFTLLHHSERDDDGGPCILIEDHSRHFESFPTNYDDSRHDDEQNSARHAEPRRTQCFTSKKAIHIMPL